MTSMKWYSDWWAVVEDSAVWSSPIRAMHAAMLRGAGEIGVAEGVAGAVDARALAVPHAEHAIELAFAAQFGGLRPGERGRGEVFIGAGVKQDVVGLETRPGAHELLVEGAERRAAIARHVAGRVEAGAAVALLLHQAQAHQRLKTADENAAFSEVVFVVEANRQKRHCSFSTTIRGSAPP